MFGPKIGALIIAIGLSLFALSTILSWGLYGTRCWEFILGNKAINSEEAAWAIGAEPRPASLENTPRLTPQVMHSFTPMRRNMINIVLAIILMIIVGVVLIGGIKRIGAVTEKLMMMTRV